MRLERFAEVWRSIADWRARADRLVPAADRKILLDPFRLVSRFARFALHHGRGRDVHREPADVHARDPELVTLLGELWRVLAEKYFRLRVEGVENVPREGPVLLVGNHCGGFLPSEGFFTALALHDSQGPQRALYALAHDFLFDDPILRRYASRLGMLRAGHDSAHRAFVENGCVLVYPGSDLDTFRPFRDRNRIVLGNRTGFIALALRENVPIVPVVDSGTHEQLVVLTRGDRLAKLLHAHRWARSEVAPVVLSLPWGLTSGFVPYIPLPAQTTLSFLPPITWPTLGPADADDPATLRRCYCEVEDAMQTELDRLARGRRFLRGRPARPARELEGADLARSRFATMETAP